MRFIFLVLIFLLPASFALSKSDPPRDSYYEFIVKDFNDKDDLTDLLNRVPEIEIIQIETIKKRYDNISRLWYKLKRYRDPEYPDDPDYPKK